MSDNQYETVNNLLECEDTLHTDSHMFFCQELIEELSDAEALIMMQLSLKADMKRCKVKGWAADKSDMKQLHFRDTFKPSHYIELNEYHKKSIL